MKTFCFYILIFLCSTSFVNAQNVAINTDGTDPNSDAILHLKSTDKGLLIPSMTSAQRTSISNVSDGILVYDTQTNSFWFRDTGTWNEIASGDIETTSVEDTDGDTKIQVEEGANDDNIRFDINGTEHLVIKENANGELLLHLTDSGNSYNTFLGKNAGQVTIRSGNFNGSRNTFIGQGSGTSNTSGSRNTFLGRQSGSNVVDGNRNTYLGASTGENNISGADNVYVGTFTGQNITSGSKDTYVGYAAGVSKTGGGNNTFLGYQAGKSNGTGTGNVFLGFQSGLSNTGSNQLAIDNSSTASPLIHGDFSANELKVNGDLEVTEALEISSSATTTPSKGSHYSNSGPLAYSYISSSAIINTDYGIASVTKTATGVYEVILDNDFTVNPVVLVTPYSPTPGAGYTATYVAAFPNEITVHITNEAGIAEDQPFSIMVMGW